MTHGEFLSNLREFLIKEFKECFNPTPVYDPIKEECIAPIQPGKSADQLIDVLEIYINHSNSSRKKECTSEE